MPATIIKSFAEKSGKSEKEVEKLWDQANAIVSKEYKSVKNGSDQYFKLVTGTLKNMLGLKETYVERQFMKFEDLIEEELKKINEEDMEKDESDEEVDEECDCEDKENCDCNKKKKNKKDAESDESDEEVEKEEK